MAKAKLRMRLGDLLVHEHIITEPQLMDALSSQKSSGKKLGAALIELGHITETQLLTFLAQQLNVEFIDVSQSKIDPKVAQQLPEVHARRHRALVIADDGMTVTLAMNDPADLNAVDALELFLSPKQVKLAAITETQLIESFDQLYRRTQDIAAFAEQLSEEHGDEQEFELAGLEDADEDATVVKLLQSIFEDAVQIKASDIHIEPEEKLVRIRQRVDGVLQESVLNEANIASALVLRLKLMASLDISEKRLPQDGRFNIKIKRHSVDVRLSTMPVQFGESVVMRLLDQSAGVLGMEQTGMPAEMQQRLRYQMSRPHGMILVTGPTGSGKTTTLYGVLNELNDPGKKIITVEDPVEYRLPRINQVQVSTKIGLDFSNVLRTTLRQDPDILMIGEMRDHETVEIGLRGALTGHLVLSTLHTNDAISSALRLTDMGAPGYLVASSLRAIIAQRLVRKNCVHCKVEHQLTQNEVNWLSHLAGHDLSAHSFYQGSGCQRCQQTGMSGRVGVFEFLEVDAPMAEALRKDDPDAFTKAASASNGFKPLAQAALAFALEGTIPVSEVLRLAEQSHGESTTTQGAD
ncbi:GspE/PulE family protein [Psychrobium sp. 1_MG-2023]|uniref:GspE/PulE family protein n=1 Tax=Psychrobium sp. 1_MG-2023 TaxID=3062624 RepID=UPI000C3267F1|nr:GspE/PulE family protein [Psychrobium sp. 1_MG-2023]MDP2560862.1 ATPase, T2SS/T4P/T4SS family [Psychrobium sp. 1_MG-2023]PKF56735.1 MSHA biogenesis protein MshE [Alteromonadales bacterium alter-6D02]